MYTKADYDREKAICDKAEAYWKANAVYSKSGWSSLSPEKAAHPDYAACGNTVRSRVERFEIFRDLPEKLIAYLSEDCANVTTWVGDHLGTVSLGTPYCSNFGDKRYPFQTCIGGAMYSGMGYGGAGMHCRLRKLKSSPK